MDSVAIFSKVNSGLVLTILLTSIITLWAGYSGKICFESNEDSKKLTEDNNFLYYPVVLSIIIFLIIFMDNGYSIYSSIKSQNQAEILPTMIASLFTLIGIATSTATLDCYNRDKTKNSNRHTFVDFIFKLSITVVAFLLFLLRNFLSQFLLSLVAINAFIATYMASKCHKSPESDKFKLSEKYLNYNLYFSGGVSIISVLLLAIQLNYK